MIFPMIHFESQLVFREWGTPRQPAAALANHLFMELFLEDVPVLSV